MSHKCITVYNISCVGKAHVTSFKAVDLREQLQMVAYPVAVEVVLSVADRYFLAWKAAMLASSEVTGDDLLTLIDQFVFCKNGLVLTSPFDELQLLDVIRKHLSQQHDVQVKLCTFDTLYGFINRV